MPRTRLFLISPILLVVSLLTASERPNVLFISIDDLNDWIGPLGHEAAITPNMDRLAERGMTFTNAHSPSMVCNPTRTAIMLGLHPSSTGIFGNGPDWRTIDATKDNFGNVSQSPNKPALNSGGPSDPRKEMPQLCLAVRT